MHQRTAFPAAGSLADPDGASLGTRPGDRTQRRKRTSLDSLSRAARGRDTHLHGRKYTYRKGTHDDHDNSLPHRDPNKAPAVIEFCLIHRICWAMRTSPY